MALRRCTRSVDGTIPIPALLYDDEDLFSSQDNVGIYDGPQKSPDHQSGTVHVTTHRLFYIDVKDPTTHSFAMELSHVTQTEYYAGLFKSSPKVTLHLSAGSPAGSGSGTAHVSENAFESWECEVCAYRNPPGLSPAAARICALCGVPRSSVPVPITPSNPGSQHISSSLPSSSFPSALTSSSSLLAPPLDDQASIPCPACTFLNHASLRNCELCSTPLPRPPSSRQAMKSAPSSRPASPDNEDDEPASSRMIKLSFRKGGDKPFYATMKRSLQSKTWEANAIGKASKGKTTSASVAIPGENATGRSGISGILRTVEISAQTTNTDMQDALQDLEALMVKAKDMVRLAGELNERLTASSTTPAASTGTSFPNPSSTALLASTEPEEATFIRSSLSQLGLQMANAPVTLDMMKDEQNWIEELARELAGVLQGAPYSDPRKEGKDTQPGMMRERGIVALDEVWGGWNRARGVALIPPSTFLSVLPHLLTCTSPPIRHRTFPSGLSVLHTPQYTHASFAARLSGLLALTGPKTTVEISSEEGITVGLADEMVLAVEIDGHVCRDDASVAIKGGRSGSGAEVRWWANVLVDYKWDGQQYD